MANAVSPNESLRSVFAPGVSSNLQSDFDDTLSGVQSGFETPNIKSEEEDGSTIDSSPTKPLKPCRASSLSLGLTEEEDAKAEYQAKKKRAEAAAREMAENLEVIRSHFKELIKAQQEIREAHAENARLGMKLIELVEREEAKKERVDRKHDALSAKVQGKYDGAEALRDDSGDALEKMAGVCGMFEQMVNEQQLEE